LAFSNPFFFSNIVPSNDVDNNIIATMAVYLVLISLEKRKWWCYIMSVLYYQADLMT
jgi:hypothetical protein